MRAFQWTNPHVFIELIVKGDKGPAVWAIEGASPNMLLRQGWRPDTLEDTAPARRARALAAQAERAPEGA